MVRLTFIYDLPRIGPMLRKWRYRNVFNLQPGDIAIDCGANVGKVTRRMALPGVRTYAFEPDPVAFEALKRNVAHLPNVICLNKAVSDHAGRAKAYFSKQYRENPEKYSTGTTLLAEKPNANTADFVECEVVDLAEFIKEVGIPVLLKMDIEGEEVKVLNKLIDLGLAQKIRNIVVETHERFPTLTEPTRVLRKRIKREKLKNIDLDWA